MTGLSNKTLPATAGPHGRADVRVGIVHFGPGAFHRAHQADYIDRLLDHDPRWGIAAVSLRTRGTVEALAAQDGLYTLAIRDREPSMRVIGAHRRFLGPEDAGEVLALLASPDVRLVTTTVTEKGYCLGPDGTLDMGHPDIVHDLGRPAVPRSVIGWMIAGLEARRAVGVPAFVVMPCDNLANNGGKVWAALTAFASRLDADLGDWVRVELRVPCTMVDSITPASDATLYADVDTWLGLEDRAAVQREAFTQWVIEDVGDIGPDLASVGATITSDVGGYERAKLRILNGAHSTLAYAGLLRGHVTVADAMRDAEMVAFIDALIREDVIPMLAPVPGLDLQVYADAVLARFANPAIAHRLDQIAQDGSQKLPYRLGDTVMANRRAGRLPRHALAAFGNWVAYLMLLAHRGEAPVDPACDRLMDAASAPDPTVVVNALIEAGFMPFARDDHEVRAAVIDGVTTAATVSV